LACDCTTYVKINQGDREERCPSDADPSKDTGSDYEVREISDPGFPDPDDSAVTMIAEIWDRDPNQILAELLRSQLNDAQRALYEMILTKSQFFPSRHWCGFPANGPASGPYFNPGNPHGWFWALDLGSKTCFFQDGWYKRRSSGTWTSEIIPYPLGCNSDQPPDKWHSKVVFCVPRSWLNGDKRRQLAEHNDEDSSTFLLDYVVGFAPFLSTADLIFNQGVLRQAFVNGDCSAAASLLGSAAGDLAVFGKMLAKISALSKTATMIQGASYVSGGGSVIFTGGYLAHKGATSQWDGTDYGQAAFMGLEIVGLILDKPAQQLVKGFVHRRFFKAKAPAAKPLACGPKCSEPSQLPPDLDVVEDSIPTIKAATQCNRTCPVGLTDAYLEELEENLRQRVREIKNPDFPDEGPMAVDIQVSQKTGGERIEVNIDGFDADGDLYHKFIGHSEGTLARREDGSPLLQVDFVEIRNYYQKLRASEIMLGRMIQHFERACTSVKRIRSQMDGDNGEVYWEAIERGLSPVEAIKETPAYKVRTKFGYALDAQASQLPTVKEQGKYVMLEVVKP
jgi:hypothetical protein